MKINWDWIKFISFGGKRESGKKCPAFINYSILTISISVGLNKSGAIFPAFPPFIFYCFIILYYSLLFFIIFCYCF